MQSLIDKLEARSDLSPSDVREAVSYLADESTDITPKASFLRALREKGETADEIAGFTRALLQRAVDPELNLERLDGPVIDVCGTGGDRMDLFNVSTTAMFVVAAGGARVVKHGNRAITSKSGGADVLEALGVRIDLPPHRFAPCVRETGLGFLFAPAWHPAFQAIGPVRRRLAAEGVPTIFNLLGPLLNPARPPFQLIGVFSPAILPKYAEALRLLGRERAWVVSGFAPAGRSIDEISTMGPTEAREVREESVRPFRIDPTELGLALADPDPLRGGSRETNAEIVRGILSGSIRDSRRDVVALNAGAALVVAGICRNLTEGLALAMEQLDNGAAHRKLQALRDFTTRD